MLRKYRLFMVSATFLVVIIWAFALILLVSQQGSTPDAMPTLIAMVPQASPTPHVLPETPLPIPSPVAPASPLNTQLVGSQPVSVPLSTVPQTSRTTINPVSDISEIVSLSSEPIAIAIPEEAVANQIIIQFAPGTTTEQQTAYIDSVGGQLTRNIDSLNTVIVRISETSLALPQSEIIKSTEPDYYVVVQLEPANDPLYLDQWALPVIHAPEAWATLSATTPDVVVAVLDSGICADNVDLIGRTVPGWDFVQNDATPQDEFGHGCSVAGVIAANGNNATGIAGVAPNVKVMPLRVLDGQGVGTYSRVAAAITYAVDHGASIINLSLGGTAPSTTLQLAIDYAVSHQVMVIAAAGNTGSQTILYPAAYDPVIAVGAVNRDLQPSTFSSTGSGIDLYAPGQGIVATGLEGYTTLSGTSLAAPHVAGVAALDLALGQTLKIDGGIVSVSGLSQTPTITPPPPQPTPNSGGLLVCDKPLADQAATAFHEAIRQRTLGNATDDQVHAAGQAYLAAAAGCFDIAYNSSLSFDGGGYYATNSELNNQFRYFGTKWGDASGYTLNNPPGVPGGRVTYSFMPDGVDLSAGAKDEEGLAAPGAQIESINSQPGRSDTCDLEARVEQAFQIWGAIANIDFVRVEDNGSPFNAPESTEGMMRIGAHAADGIGGHLAHAFFPPPVPITENEPPENAYPSGTGDLHFDTAENWGCAPGLDSDGRAVLDIGLVALHEVGHAIGLDHEEIADAIAVMNPFYNTDFTGPNGPILQPDDITGAKAIYGVRGFDSPAGLAPLGVTQDNTPAFLWTPVSIASQYELQIGTEETFTTPLLDQTIPATVTSGQPTFNLREPLLNGEYLWRVRAFNEASGGWGAWSTITEFTVRIGVPTLLSPLDGEGLARGQVTFQWTTVSGDDPRFDLQIATRSDFASISLVEDVKALTTRVFTTGLATDGVYYWRVRADNGDWSIVRRFSIASNAPIPLTPTGGVVLDTNRITFQWGPVAGATEYQYQIDTSPNFVGLLFLDNLFLNKLFLNKLFLNKLFLNKLSEDPLFLNKLFGDDLFLNKLFSDPLFLNKLFLNKLLLDKLFLNKITDTSLEVGKPLSEGIHYWRVRAHLADDTWGEWSDAVSFIVDTPRSDVVINEVETNDPSWIELYNSGVQPVNLSTWQFLSYLPNGQASFAYSFPDNFIIQPGAYVTLHEANGNDTATDLYMGPNTIEWVIPNVGATSTANEQSFSSPLALMPGVASSDSAEIPAVVVVPTTVTGAMINPPVLPEQSVTAQTEPINTPVAAQSSGDDDGVVTAQGIHTILIGETVSNGVPEAGAGNITPAGEIDTYNFEGEAGQVLNFDALTNNVSGGGSILIWLLVNHLGEAVPGFTTSTFVDKNNVILPEDDTYSLKVQTDLGTGTGTYSFRIIGITQNFDVAVGDTISDGAPVPGAGNIEVSGAQDTYTFTAAAGQVLNFRRIDHTVSFLEWTLTDPNGQPVSGFGTGPQTFADINVVLLSVTGEYTLLLAPQDGTSTGTYSFELQDVPFEGFFIAIGDTVSDGVPSSGAGNIEVIGAKDVYTFNGTANQVVNFHRIDHTVGFLEWTLTDPDDQPVPGFGTGPQTFADINNVTLPATGEYKLLLAPQNGTSTGSYSFQIVQASGDDPQVAPVYNVTTTDITNDGVCSISNCTLIEAFNAANVDALDSTINLGSGQTYTLTAPNNSTNGLPVITTTITIYGHGSTINRDGSASAFRIMEMISNLTLTLDGVTISGGDANGGLGGGILKNGNSVLILNGATITQNTALGGGGIYASGGSISITNSTLSNNIGVYGAGLSNNGNGDVDINNSSFISNTSSDPNSEGGAIFTNSGIVAIHNTTFSDNQSNLGAGVMVHTSGTLNLFDSTFQDNLALSLGGAIVNRNVVNMQTVSFINNSADSGGAIYNYDNSSSLNMFRAIFDGNTATSGSGGAIYGLGNVSLRDESVITNNTATSNGGGIYKQGGNLTIEESDIAVNDAGGMGGGIYNTQGDVILENVNLNNNTAGDGGGAVRNQDSPANMTITSSVIGSNSATVRGGAIFNSALLNITNTTLTSNTSPGGGAILNNGTLKVLSSTLAANTSAGDGVNILNADTGSTQVKNSIFATISSADNCANGPSGTFSLVGSNLSTDASCDSATQVTEVQLALSNLNSNGGRTQTIALGAGSLAIDAAADCGDFGSGGVTVDQRGVDRPQGSTCDIGAFEKVNDTAQIPSVYTVNSTSYTNDFVCGVNNCTLIEALNAANNDSGPSVVNLGTDETYSLPFAYGNDGGLNGLPTISTDINIFGHGSTIIRSGEAVEDFRLFYVNAGGFLTLSNLTLNNGSSDGAGGAILNAGSVVMFTVTLDGNSAPSGGAIYNNGNLTIYGSSLQNNHAVANDGGAIFTNGALSIDSSTLTDNTAVQWGGAIVTGAAAAPSIPVNLTNLTVVGNTGGASAGIAVFQGNVQIKNSIIADNTGSNCSGGFTSLGMNFSTDASCSGFSMVTSGALNLGPLGLNGGTNQNFPLVEPSLAIDAATDCTDVGGVSPIEFDQRGIARPQGANCDLGAFELEATDTAQTGPTYFVNTTLMSDDGICGDFNCSLIDAINAANEDGVSSTAIELGVNQTYSLSAVNNTVNSPNGLPAIISGVVIHGHGSTITRSAGATEDFRFFFVDAAGVLWLDYLTLENGQSAVPGGAILNFGETHISSSTLFNNSAPNGGGVANYGGTLTVENTTFQSNHAPPENGGAIITTGPLTVTNSTFVGNDTAQLGGAIYVGGSPTTPVKLSNVTIVGNSGNQAGGVANLGGLGGVVEIKNSIIANNTGPNCEGTLNSQGVNYSTDATCAGFNEVTGSALNLGLLASNGGLTQTVALGGNSVAINTVTDCTTVAGASVTIDQREVTRPQGLNCDAGAFEAVPDTEQTGPNFTVNTNAITDDGLCGTSNCTLIEAMNAANVYGQGNINIGSATYTLDTVDNTTNGPNGLPVVMVNMNFSSSSATITRSSAGGTPDFRLFSVADNKTLTLNNVTLSNGNAGIDNGGAIYSEGTLFLSHLTITNNTAVLGGAVYNNGGSVFTHSAHLTNNTASDSGGAIYSTGAMNLNTTEFSGNVAAISGTNHNGGAIYSTGEMLITNSTFDANDANFGTGGGIYATGVDPVQISSTTFTNNSSTYGSAIFSNTQLTLDRDAFSLNAASLDGTVYNISDLTVTNSTFNINAVVGAGGGIHNSGTATVTNSTFADNTSTGGTFNNGGTANLSFVTISGNDSAGVATNSGQVTLKNSIVASNTGPSCINNSSIGWDGVNLFTDASCGFGTQVNASQLKLATLANNGGTTQTIALNFGSVAIDAATECTDLDFTTLTSDQRGVSRPQGTECDAGAYERSGETVQTGPTYTVNTTATTDDGLCSTVNCTLIEAINAANDDGVNSTIILGSSQSYLLLAVNNTGTRGANGLPVITSIITINGNSATILRDEDALSFRLFEVAPAGNLTLNSVTLRHGKGDSGGAILNGGTVTINDSTLDENEATVDEVSIGGAILNLTNARLDIDGSTFTENEAVAEGGAISNSGSMTISDSTIEQNTAPNGGAISNISDVPAQNTLQIINSAFANNSSDTGGAITIGTGDVTILNGNFNANSATQTGGTIEVDNGTLFIIGADFSNNTADVLGGAVYALGGTATINQSLFSGNQAINGSGGAIAVDNTGVLTIGSSLFATNTAQGSGGAISSDGTVVVKNSTFSGNVATTGAGGAADNAGSMQFNNSTFVDNSAAGVGNNVNGGVGALKIKNSILVSSDQNCSGTVVILGATFATGNTCSIATQVTSGQLNLGSLDFNGGPTQTIALNAGSVAIDAVTDCTLEDGTTPVGPDQRGVTRPQGTKCDSGAFEVIASGDTAQTGPIFTVNTTTVADDSVCGTTNCTLIEAINAANIYSGAATIELGSGQTYTLTAVNNNDGGDGENGLPSITGNVIVNGHNSTITRSNAGATPEFRILRVAIGATLTLNNTTLLNGKLTAPLSSGGGILSKGTLFLNSSGLGQNTAYVGGGLSDGGPTTETTITDTVISDNIATFAGGGIYHYTGGTLTLNGSYIQTNTAGNQGGGIWNRVGATLFINNSFTTNNTASSDIGGGIYNGGTLTVTGGGISNNTAFFYGGGIYNDGGALNISGVSIGNNEATNESGGGIYTVDGTLTMTTSSVANNTAPDSAGIYNEGGSATLTNSLLSNNISVGAGGGFYNADSTAILTMKDSVVEYNGANFGGGIANNGTATIVDSTFAHNSANTGSSIYNGISGSVMNLSFVTVTMSTSQAIANISGTFNIKNSIVAFQSGGMNCQGTIGVSGVNFADDSTCSGFTQVSTAQLNFGIYDNHGGLHYSAPLGTGSVAIDAVTDCTDLSNTLVTTDERSISRPQGTACDAGSYEATGAADTAQSGPTYTVNTTAMANDGVCGTTNCTLFEAINAANTQPGANTIELGTNQTYSISIPANMDTGFGKPSGLPIINTPIIINAHNSTVQRNASFTCPDAVNPEFRLVRVDAGGQLTLNNVTLRNGCKRDDGAGGGAIYVANGATLALNSSTIRDNKSEDGGGAIRSEGSIIVNNTSFINNSNTDGYGGAIDNLFGGTLIITNSSFTSNQASSFGGAISNYSTGTAPTLVRLTNTTFDGNSADTGGALFNQQSGTGIVSMTLTNVTLNNNSAISIGAGLFNQGFVTITNSNLTNNTASTGGAIYNVATLNLTDVNITGNTSGQGAGGIYTANPGVVTMLRGSVSNNISNANDGGGIYIDSGSLNITNTTLNNNSAINDEGGAIFAFGGTVTITGATITNNTSGLSGGAIFVDTGTVNITNTAFTGNTATGSGGGIFNDTGTVNLTTVTMTNNVATTGSGGGVANDSGANITVIGSTFTSNHANLLYGGGISNTGGVTVDQSTFTQNTAGIGGGGLTSAAFDILMLTNSTFSLNTAGQGGGVFTYGGTITNVTFTGNTATGAIGGGGLSNSFRTTTVSGSTFTNNTATTGSGGGALNDASATLIVKNTRFTTNVSNGVSAGGPLGGGAITTYGTLSLSNVSVDGNQGQYGAGLLISTGASATVENSAFTNNQTNSSGGGGGLYNYQGMLTVSNTTFGNNFAQGVGGAIANDTSSTVTLTHVTIADNAVSGGSGSAGAAIYAVNGMIDVRNSIITNNTPDNCSAGSGNYTVTTSLQFPGPAECGSATVLDPMLGALVGNPAFFPLLAGSPAIDSGNSTICTPKDQRGILRGFDADGTLDSPAQGDCDLGAIETFERSLLTAGPQLGTTGGGAALIDTLTAQDFVQFGDTNLIPPQGTNWTGGTPELPAVGQTLGRDPASSDTDDRTDWSAQSPTMGGQNGVKILINEIFPGSVDAIELYNPSVETVRMDGWKLITYNADGAIEVNYTFGRFSLAPNGYVVLREGSGTNDIANLYLNASISWADWNARGAVSLTNGSGGIDFVRFGDGGTVIPQSEDGIISQAVAIAPIVQPPSGTPWTGISPTSPLPNQSLGRDSESTDVDDGSDWFAQPPSLGLQNPLIRPAVNDDFEDAIVVLRLPFRNTQVTSETERTDATEPIPSCGFNVGHTVWYQFTARTSGTVRFQTDGSDYNTVMAVYTDTGNGLVEVVCDDDSGEGQRSHIDLNMVTGTTYYFMIGGIDYAKGNMVFSGQPPVNDDFDAAIQITGLPFTNSQNTIAASLPFDDPVPSCGLSVGRSVWYSFTATSDARVVFRTTNSDYDTVVSLWTGTRGHLVQVGCNDDAGLTVSSSLDFRAIPGTTYYIMVAGSQGTGGNLIFTADLLTRPANDFFANPAVISDPLPYRADIDTTGATSEPLDIANLTCGVNVGSTVWYSYTPTENRTVTFQTVGSTYDTVLAVWTDINQPPVACNDDAPGGFYSSVTVNVTVGTTYRIMVGGYANSAGRMILNAFIPAAAPANDERANATHITSLPFSLHEDVTGATSTTDDPVPSCSGSLSNTVWFRYQPSGDTQLRLQTAGSDFDTVLAVFANVSGTLAEIACNDDSQQSAQSLLLTNTGAGNDLYIMVGDFAGTGGQLVFEATTIDQRPTNDIFENATLITNLPFSAEQSSIRATSASDDPVPTCGTNVGSTVWYAFTAQESGGILRLETTGSDFDTTLAVYTGTRGSLTEVVCNDDSGSSASVAELTPVAGTTYYFMIGGNGAINGSLKFRAELFPPPANDDVVNATEIVLDNDNTFSAGQDTRGASSATDDPKTACNTTTASTVWYRFTASAAGTLSINTEGSNYNTVLAVYTGTPANLTTVGCDDNTGTNLTARLDSISMTPDTTYYVLIGGAFGQTGSLAFNIKLLTVPDNDDFDNATLITALPYITTQDTTGATVALDDLVACNAVPAKTVWYSFTATGADLISLQSEGTTYNTVIAAYTGTRGSLTQVACQTSGSLDFVTTPNTTYYIMVGGFGGASGTFSLQANQISLVANDDFDNATEITALPYTNTQDTAGASTASDDPLTCNPSVGKSVWYRYTAGANGIVALNLNGTSYNTVLSVYTGTRSSLTLINCTLFNGADIPVTAGTTYYIMVSGFEGGSGTLTLDARLPGSIAVSNIPNPISIPAPGGNVSFTVRVTNTSPTDSIMLNSLSNDLYGNLNGQGTCTLPQTIALSGFYECSFTTAVNGSVGTTISNVVTASGKDQNNKVVTATAASSVNITVVNTPPPSVVADQPVIEVNEGVTAANSGTYTDPNGAGVTLVSSVDTLEYAGGIWSWSMPTSDNQPDSQITITATDELNQSGSTAFTLKVNNVAPTAAFASLSSSVNINVPVLLTFSNPVDPSSVDTAAGFKYAYDCTNDGIFEAENSVTASFPCTYTTDGAKIARGRITDKDGSSTEYTTSIMVNGGPTTITLQINGSANDVNQDGNTYDATNVGVWIGNAASVSYTGLRFTGVPIPQGAQISSARLQMYDPQGQWSGISMNIGAEAADNSVVFSSANRPSARTLGTTLVPLSNNVQWTKNAFNDIGAELASILQQVVSRSGWQNGNNFSIIIRGTGAAYGRKGGYAYDFNPALAPRLVITYVGHPTPQQPPQAFAENYTTLEDTVLSVPAPGLLANDVDANSDILTAIRVANPTNGTLALSANGAFTYTPNSNFNGSDSFTYKANDGNADSNVVTVNITVTPANDPPVANDDAAATTQNTTINIAVLANDTDVDSTVITTTSVTTPAHGTAVINPNGTIAYTPASGFTGTDSFNYQACDTMNACDSALVTVSVTGAPGQTTTVTLQINGGVNDVNEDGSTYDAGAQGVWAGNGNGVSYTGLRFTGVTIPQGAQVTSARLQMYDPQGQWLSMSINIGAEDVDNSLAFSSGSRPSSRILAGTHATLQDNILWTKNSFNNVGPELASVVQQVINRAGWNTGNSLSLVIQGTGQRYARKYGYSFEGNPAFAPRLVITYQIPVVVNLTVPTAAFMPSVTTGQGPLTVQFANQSTGNITGYNWSFGDGGSSADANPSHTFTAPGTYTVVLTASGPGGSSTAQTIITVVAPPTPAPTAAFTPSVTSGQGPLTVQFANQSTGNITGYNWNFGDGGSSADANPFYTFANPGIYTVTLIVNGVGGSSTAQTIITVVAPPTPAPTAAFIPSVTSGQGPLTIQFMNQSSGAITAYNWTFGDGGSSTDANPFYTFANPGIYTVTLTVNGQGGSSTAQTIITVISPPTPAPTATFTPSVTSGQGPLTIQFMNQSSGAITAYNWTFGDGGSSTDANPSYTFANPGIYTVTLTVNGQGGSSTAQVIINVEASSS